jgi:hypothetical protein
MNTNLKVILTAIGIATLASPIMAQSLTTRPYVGQYVGQSAADISNAHGSVAGARKERTQRAAPVVESNQIHIDDPLHVPFPQQGGSGY